MKNPTKILQIQILSILILFLQAAYVTAQTDVPAGDVSGTWSVTNSPYNINGEITVPDSNTLTIEPGVQVIFTGHYKLNVQGTLLAVGTNTDTITFSAQDTATGWNGLRFIHTPSNNDTSKVMYCRIEDGRTTESSDSSGGAILVNGLDKLVISHCLIMHNRTTGAIYTGGGGIAVYGSSPDIESNTICFNEAIGGHGGGILLVNGADVRFVNNLVFGNEATGGGAMALNMSDPVIMNNTFTANSSEHAGGLDFIYTSPTVINSIIYGNTAGYGKQIGLAGGVQPAFYNCDIEGGTAAIPADLITSGSYNGTYTDNIDEDPMFIDPVNSDYHLSDASPCISAGNDTIDDGGNLFYSPVWDAEGNARPDPSGTPSDIGALENANGHVPMHVSDLKDHNAIRGVTLAQNYPNPFRSETIIQFVIPENLKVKLQVFDPEGRTVANLVDKILSPGTYQFKFDATGLSGGIYFYRLAAGNTIQIRKCQVIK